VSDRELDDLVPRAYALLGRVMGSLVLPLVREVERRGLAGQMDAPNTAAWLRWLLRVTPSQARKLVEVAQAVDGDGMAATGTALDPLAAPRPAEDGLPDPRGRARRMADALVELAQRGLRAGDLPEQGGERPTVVVTMRYDKLAEDVGTGTFDTGEPLPAEAV